MMFVELNTDIEAIIRYEAQKYSRLLKKDHNLKIFTNNVRFAQLLANYSFPSCRYRLIVETTSKKKEEEEITLESIAINRKRPSNEFQYKMLLKEIRMWDRITKDRVEGRIFLHYSPYDIWNLRDALADYKFLECVLPTINFYGTPIFPDPLRNLGVEIRPTRIEKPKWLVFKQISS